MKKRAYDGQRIVVLGAGKSGVAAARFLAGRGASVTLADDAPREKLSPAALALEASGVTLAAGGITTAGVDGDLCVLSPGLSVDDPRVRAFADRSIPVWSEVELAAREISAPIVAITGTNGKTTVTEMAGNIFRAAGRKVFVGGNVGTPLIEAAGEPWDVVVAEISSFQLEAVHTFRPRVAVWLNLTGDHLDRHDGLDAYAEAKGRIFLHQDAGDAAVVNRDDPIVWEHACRSHATLLPYSVERPLGVGGWREGKEAVILLPGTDGVRLPASELKLPGLHNLGNALAATLAAAALGVEVRAAWRAACGFEGLAHRIQHFLTWRGVRFVDDSKATNVDAAKAAMETVAGPLVLLAGGVDKRSDYGPLKPAVARWARRVVVVGSAAERMVRELEGTAPVAMAADWAEGVRIAVAEARPGDTVLLAPAAASFDFFSGYAERGDVFQRLCREETQRIDRGEG